LRDPAAELTGNRTIKLRPGQLYITFEGNNPPFCVYVNAESPLYGQVKEGCYVNKLKLEDGTEYTGMDRAELIKALADNSESAGRVMYLKDRKTLPTPAERMVPLRAGKIGVSFKGDAPRVTGIKPNSPIMGKVKLGLHVEKLIAFLAMAKNWVLLPLMNSWMVLWISLTRKDESFVFPKNQTPEPVTLPFLREKLGSHSEENLP
jgi:hypothetical protein